MTTQPEAPPVISRETALATVALYGVGAMTLLCGALGAGSGVLFAVLHDLNRWLFFAIGAVGALIPAIAVAGIVRALAHEIADRSGDEQASGRGHC